MARETWDLQALRAQVREDAKVENSTFASDPEIDSKINRAISILYARSINVQNSFDIVGKQEVLTGTSPFALPADFYEMHSLFRQDSSREHIDMMPSDRTFFAEESADDYTLILEYYPTPPRLVDDGDSFSFLVGWGDYVIADVAARILEMEESENAGALARRDAALAMVLEHVPTSSRVTPRKVANNFFGRMYVRRFGAQGDIFYRMDSAGIRIFRVTT